MITVFLTLWTLVGTAFANVDPNCSKVENLTAPQVAQCLTQIEQSNLHWRWQQALDSAASACAILGLEKDTLATQEAAISDPNTSALIVEEMKKQRDELKVQIASGEEICAEKTARVGRLKAAVKVQSELQEALIKHQRELADALTPEELTQATNTCTDLRKQEKAGEILTFRQQDELVLACEDEINWAKQYGPRRPSLKPAHLLTLER